MCLEQRKKSAYRNIKCSSESHAKKVHFECLKSNLPMFLLVYTKQALKFDMTSPPSPCHISYVQTIVRTVTCYFTLSIFNVIEFYFLTEVPVTFPPRIC